MKNINILDCTIRDGGYINDWQFGEIAIKGIYRKAAESNIEMVEVGFVKDTNYDVNRAVYSTIDQIHHMIQPKNENAIYVAMLDVNDCINYDDIPQNDHSTIDVFRVIFKKDKVELGYKLCKIIKDKGYELFVQFVATDTYDEQELERIIEKFNTLNPDAMYIVDTLGSMRKKKFLSLVKIFDEHMSSGIAIGYHSHNNLQQASSNAEELLEIVRNRNIIIDASIYGMGRGAGNLNLELFAQFLNESYGKNYKITPLLEVVDDYLMDIYKNTPWGYSLPYYITATHQCHPNYANFLVKQNALTLKEYSEIVSMISDEDKLSFSEERAEYYYEEYQRKSCDDKKTVDALRKAIGNREILIIGTGTNVKKRKNEISDFIDSKKPFIFLLNHWNSEMSNSVVFCTNPRRYHNLISCPREKLFVSSNVDTSDNINRINYMEYAVFKPNLSNNSALICINLLVKMGYKKLYLAGIDGYSDSLNTNNFLDCYNGNTYEIINSKMSEELSIISHMIELIFITETEYIVR